MKRFVVAVMIMMTVFIAHSVEDVMIDQSTDVHNDLNKSQSNSTVSLPRPTLSWQTFNSTDYTKPVTGIIYTDPGAVRPVSGMPLGSLDTGCLDLELSGTFGYSSIFNHLTPRGGPVNKPFLGISMAGKTWVLTSGKTKTYDEDRMGTESVLGSDLILEGVQKANSIKYWGHYPIADMEFETNAPVRVSLRAWSPFLPGDSTTSNTPAAVFEVNLRNDSKKPQKGTLAFNFPGFKSHDSIKKAGYGNVEDYYIDDKKDFPASKIIRKPIKGKVSGVEESDEKWNMAYALAPIGKESVRFGSSLDANGSAWANISEKLPEITPDDGGSSLSVDFELAVGESEKVRFVLAWYAPQWKGAGSPRSDGRVYSHMYAARFANAEEVAQFIGRNHESLLARIVAWQDEIYKTDYIPGWLADSLINSFYLIPECSIWAQAKKPLPAWVKPEEGLFALNECPRECSQLNVLPTIIMGDIPIAYFFPKLDRSIVQQFTAYQDENGDIPVHTGFRWHFDLPNLYGYQLVMTGANYMGLLDRNYLVTGDDEFLKKFYPQAKKACKYNFNLRPDYGPSQIMAMQPEGVGRAISWLNGSSLTEWYEDRTYHGYQVHAGGFRMAAAGMIRRWAEKMGDTEYVAELDEILKAGAKAAEKHLWAGDHYMLYNEPETGKKLNVLFTPALDGQLYARQHGLPEVFPKERIDKVLDLFKKVCALHQYGISPTYADSTGDKTWSDDAGYITGHYNYVNQATYFLAMTYMYEGEKEFGLDLLKNSLKVDYCINGLTWEGAHVGSPKTDDGKAGYGTDYSMRLALWGVPAAIKKQDIRQAMKPGELVDRIKRAAKGDSPN